MELALVGTSKWIFPQERPNPFPMEGETSKKITNAHGAELNSTDGSHDVSHAGQIFSNLFNNVFSLFIESLTPYRH